MTDRIPLDELTSDALDQLYAELATTRGRMHLLDAMRQSHMDAACAAVQRAERAEAAIERVRALHQPMSRAGFLICTRCSGWNGYRCLGVVADFPCDTVTALDEHQEQP